MTPSCSANTHSLLIHPSGDTGLLPPSGHCEWGCCFVSEFPAPFMHAIQILHPFQRAWDPASTTPHSSLGDEPAARRLLAWESPCHPTEALLILSLHGQVIQAGWQLIPCPWSKHPWPRACPGHYGSLQEHGPGSPNSPRSHRSGRMDDRRPSTVSTSSRGEGLLPTLLAHPSRTVLVLISGP